MIQNNDKTNVGLKCLLRPFLSFNAACSPQIDAFLESNPQAFDVWKLGVFGSDIFPTVVCCCFVARFGVVWVQSIAGRTIAPAMLSRWNLPKWHIFIGSHCHITRVFEHLEMGTFSLILIEILTLVACLGLIIFEDLFISRGIHYDCWWKDPALESKWVLWARFSGRNGSRNRLYIVKNISGFPAERNIRSE